MANNALEGLLASRTAAPQGAAPQRPQQPNVAAQQAGAPPPGGQGVGPADPADVAQLGLPPGTLEIRVGPDDPAFRNIAARVSAEGGQLVALGGKTFAVPPQRPQQAPQQAPRQGATPPAPGLLA